MNDLAFNLVTREITFLPDGSDFAVTAHPSVQNGGILLYALCPNPDLPMYGIGLFPEIAGGTSQLLVYFLNRWQQQAYQDGATVAKWSIKSVNGQEALVTQVSYE